MILDKIEVVHEVCRGDILAFLDSLQTFKTTVLFLGDGIEAVTVTSPLAQDLTDAAWRRLPGLIQQILQEVGFRP